MGTLFIVLMLGCVAGFGGAALASHLREGKDWDRFRYLS